MRPPVHTEGAICGCSVPRRGICPRRGGILWMRKGKCGRLSTQKVPFVDVPCYGGNWGCREGHLYMAGRYFVDAEGKCGRLSTQRVPFVDVRCLGGAFVHGGEVFCGCRREMRPPVHTEGAICGRKVPRKGICPRREGILWMQKGNAAACPHRRCHLWKFGALEGHLSTEGRYFVDGWPRSLCIALFFLF